MTAGRHLREVLARPDILILPGAFDALSARLIQFAGFDAVYATGAGFSNAAFGFPDIGLVGMSEVVEHVARITDAVDIPVIVDADTGYGEVLQVRRTVRALERAGAAAIQLEDQVSPKRCGHFNGQRIIAAPDMLSKIAAAVDSRRSDDLVIIARTDARSVHGLSDAVARAGAYAAAGADVIFVEAPRSKEELLGLPRQIGVPLLANMVEGGKTAPATSLELHEAGYKIALFANAALRASMAAVAEVMRILHADGDTAAALPLMMTWQERQRLVGLEASQKLEERYVQAGRER